MKNTSNFKKNEPQSLNPKKLTLKDEGNIKPEILNEIIVNKKGKPDLLAIDIYVEVRSWFKLKKTIVNGNIVYSSKLKGHGFQIGYEYFIKKYKCTGETIRTKLVLLEELGLLTREFRTEYFKGKKFNNTMYLLVWKDTPHFYSGIGLEKPKKSSSNCPEKQGHLSQNFWPPIQKNLDNIYVIPNNQPINNQDLSDLCSSEDISLGTESQDLKNQDTNFVSSNQTGLEANTEFHSMSRVDRMIAREQARRERDALEGNSFEEVLARAKAERDKERLALAKQQETARTEPPKVVPDQEPQKPQEPTPNSELLEVARLELAQVQQTQNDTHIKNGNVYHGNKLLNEFEFTDELIDAVIDKSDKTHFSRERVRAIMRNIVVSNPNLRIWGGKNAFINYMVKAVNNEKEFTKEEKAQSLAEMKRKEAEQVMYDFQHRVIRYF